MKKIACLISALVLAMCFGALSYAEEQAKPDEPMKAMHEGHKGMAKKGMKAMHCMMMKDMMKKEMIATSDGGVAVLAGNKLMKFDKNLKLVKEVELKMDMEAMMKCMKDCRDMMKKCHEESKKEEESK